MARTRTPQPTGGDALIPGLDRLARHPRTPWILAAVHFAVMAFIGIRYHVVGDYGVETDFFWSYVPAAKQVLGGIITIEDFRGPLYPIVLAFFQVVFRDHFLAGILLSTASASLAVVMSFLLFRRFVRADAALLGALLMAVGSFFVQYTYTAGTDMFFTALSLAGAMFLFRNEQRVWRDVTLAMLMFALAYLTRYNGIYAAAGVPAALLLGNPFSESWKERARTAGAALGAFLMFIAPWGLYSLVEKGAFFYSRNYQNIAYEMFAKGTVSWDQFWSVEAQKYQSLSQVIFADPGRFMSTVVGNAYEHATSDLGSLLGWQIGVAALLGFVLMIRERPGRVFGAFFVFALSYFGILLLVFYGERFSLFLVPAYLLATLWVVSQPRFNRMKLWKTVPLGGVALVALVLWTAGLSHAYNREMIDSGPTELLQIAAWAEQNLPAEERGKVLVARKPHPGYHLRMEWAYFPYVQTYEELLTELRKSNASYLYFGLMEAGMRPQFQFLLDPSRATPELTPLVYTLSPPAVLYRIEYPK